MSEKPDPEPCRARLPFTPVPRAKDRANGWKPEVQRAFIEALAETGSVKSAAAAVGRTTEGAYHLRRHPGAGEFAAAWEAALVRAASAIPPPSLPLLSTRELMLILRAHNRRCRDADEA